MEAEVKAKLEKSDLSKHWTLVLSTDKKERAELLKMFYNEICMHWERGVILRTVASKSGPGNNQEITFLVSSEPSTDL